MRHFKRERFQDAAPPRLTKSDAHSALPGGCLLHDRAELIQRNHDEFRRLLAESGLHLKDKKYELAAVYGEMAASYASSNHCGLFASYELERLLTAVGKTLPPLTDKSRLEPARRGRILHIATVVLPVGGHSRMLWRWIELDSENVHSLALTRQVRAEVPHALVEAISRSGGGIYRINGKSGGLLRWAQYLREVASAADLIVLHVHNFDALPVLAFADRSLSPPVVFVNHADHIFWLGASISDVVASLRDSGARLCWQRRGIPAERNVMLPTALGPIHRELPRLEAKRRLGIAEDSVVLLCIARAVKFKEAGGANFADAHVPLLREWENAVLVIVGPGATHDWVPAIRQVGGRIIVHPERQDTATFYEAADIYVDSYPFVSITSLLEAACYGLPLVTRYSHPAGAEILGADMPSLEDNLIRARNLDEYTEVLARLVGNKDFRLALGEKTRAAVVETHGGSEWLKSLRTVYDAAKRLPRRQMSGWPVDVVHLGEPDASLPYVLGQGSGVNQITQYEMRIMPFENRVRYWMKFLLEGEFVKSRHPWRIVSLLLPEWLLYRTWCIWTAIRR